MAADASDEYEAVLDLAEDVSSVQAEVSSNVHSATFDAEFASGFLSGQWAGTRDDMHWSGADISE